MTAAEAWTNTAQGAYLAFGTTPIGTVTTAEAMRIDNTGFVGIGTMAPPVKLTVSSNAAPPQPGIIANMAVVGADNTIARVIIDAYGTGFAHLNFRAAAGTAAAPSAVISGQEIGRINATGYFVGTYSGPRTSIISYAMETWAVGAQGAALAFNTTPIGTQVTAEAMRIADNGNVGIGTTAPGNKLAVVGQLAAGGSPVIQVRTGPNGADSTSVMMQFADFASAAQIGAIARTGTNTVVYSTTSDERLKEDISDSQLGIEELMQVKVRDFTWKADGSHAHGLVAQEVAKVYPQAVHEGGKDPNLEPWMIDYGRLTPLLIKGMQQQQEMIAALQAKVAALESATVH
jgi:hypothetical protein